MPHPIIIIFGAVLALLAPLPASALSCGGAPASLTVLALPRTANETQKIQESTAFTCTFAPGDSAIHLLGTLKSELNRARGFVVARFLNGSGGQLLVKEYGPWLGEYSGLAFNEAIAVPNGAAKVEIRVRAVSTRTSADNVRGTWQINGLTVSPGVAVMVEEVNTVITEVEDARWRFSTVPANAVGTFKMQLRDLDGNLVNSPIITKSNTQDVTTIDFGKQPIGHYTASVQFIQSNVVAGGWKSTLAVLPNDPPPNDVRFGLDTGVSWGIGAKSENQVVPFLEILRKAGVGTLRDRLTWADDGNCLPTNWGLAPGSGARYDWVAKAIKAARMESVQVFHNAPACAGATGIPLDYNAIYNFGRAYAENLGKTVRNIEYWNEQQAVDFFKGYPFQYASGLKAFYAGVKSVDPAINVLIGSASRGGGRFFEETYLNGGAAFFDTRNQHHHGRDVDNNTFILSNYLDNFFDASVKEQESNYGVAGKSGWFTERGYSLQPQDRGADGDWQAAELAQAEFLVRTYASGFATGYERVFYFIGGEYFEGEYHIWGIVRDDFSTKPAYVALAVLTRHLADAKVVASECHGACATSPGRTVYFKKGDEYVAVTWGGGNAAALRNATKIKDIFGRTLANPQNTIKPLLLSGINNVPATARMVTAPTPKVSGLPPLMVTGALLIDGEEHTSPRRSSGASDIDVSVAEGSTVEIAARAYTFGNSAGNLQVECAAGPGLVQMAPPQIAGDKLTCRFQANGFVDKKSHVTLRATKGAHSDAVWITLKPDIATVIATLPADPLLADGRCLKWIGSAGANIVSLNVDEIASAAGASCPSVSVAGSIKDSNKDSWIFPYAAIPQGTLAGTAGLRMRVANIPSANPPPTSLMMQLYEPNGEVWLLNTYLFRESEGVYSGLFSFAEQGAWGAQGNGVLDIGDVYRILLGWGGYSTGQAGDRHGYMIEQIEVLSFNPATPGGGTGTGGGTPGTPGAGTPGSGTDADMALRDAIYLYHQPISGIASKVKTLAGYNCDVFQMLLDVESGHTDIALLESEAASNTASVYRDRIHATSPMFSYTLYAPQPVKTFTLGRFLDNA
ncbi:MAG: hypothetical protein LBB76_04560, partial [Azoarcus sp.]|nr:hypothetical protein [Azoarcus sp.]